MPPLTLQEEGLTKGTRDGVNDYRPEISPLVNTFHTSQECELSKSSSEIV